MSDTIARLAQFQARPAPKLGAAAEDDRLLDLQDFGSNPGALDAWLYLPPAFKMGVPLVVVMHGCTQNAHDYDRGAGWSRLAAELGFAVLLPEQRRSNNFNLCFNWYETQDNCRDGGEPLSIKQMIDTVVNRYGIDPARVFVTGLSAGGAMTSVMLATYPETFAAGAIIAGLPYGSANGVPQAFDRMRGYGSPSGAALARLVREASSGAETWPHISVWHGDADTVVVASNGDDIIEQWRPLHGVPKAPSVVDKVDGYPHRIWHDRAGRPVIQDYRITGMGHGTPLKTAGDGACGKSGPHMLDVAISSTRRIAQDWGLGTAQPNKRGQSPARGMERLDEVLPASRSLRRSLAPVVRPSITETIEGALRAAGLMK